ncbi:hypothetical protein [Mucilaginibacter sp.]|uniref:hypothetical protein n=1 Tax=Mucilaginibacter sp. TaxID=1882438 RepID=UPI0026328E10|nr:hypothetical protein [Mucilaginibacter sp.]MDB5128053.1 hypothetical protein [Mucilaginibacter sp.]
MKYFKLWFALFALNLFFCGCHYTNYMLEVHNSSKQKITVLYSNTVKPSSINENNIAYYIADDEIIKPDSVNTISKPGKQDAWHQYIEEGKDKHLYLFIFSVDTLKKYDSLYSMGQLSAMGKYLKVFKYSEPELIKMNWKVNYKEN